VTRGFAGPGVRTHCSSICSHSGHLERDVFFPVWQRMCRCVDPCELAPELRARILKSHEIDLIHLGCQIKQAVTFLPLLIAQSHTADTIRTLLPVLHSHQTKMRVNYGANSVKFPSALNTLCADE
jgi:hypothetical protein